MRSISQSCSALSVMFEGPVFAACDKSAMLVLSVSFSQFLG